MTDPVERPPREPFNALASKLQLRQAVGQFEGLPAEGELPAVEKKPSSAKNQSVKKILSIIEAAEDATKTAVSEAAAREAQEILGQAQGRFLLEAERKTCEQTIKDEHEAQLRQAAIPASEIPEASTVNLPNYFLDLSNQYRAEVPRLGLDPHSLEAQGFVTVANFFLNVREFITNGDVDSLQAHVYALLPKIKSSFIGNDYTKVKITLEKEIVRILKDKHMDRRTGVVNEQDLAQALFNVAQSGLYAVPLPEDPTHRDDPAKNRLGLYRHRYVDPTRESEIDFFRLSGDVRESLMKDPWKPFEDMLRDIEKGQQSSDQLVEAVEQRMRMVSQHVADPAFRKDWYRLSEYHLRTRRSIEQFYQDIVDKVNARKHGHLFRMMIQGGDLKQIHEAAGLWGSHGLFESLIQNNAQVAFNRFEQIIEQMRLVADPNNPNTVQKVRLTPSLIEQLKKRVFEELSREKKLYGFESDADVQAAVNTAYNIFTNTQRMGLHIAWGKSPAESGEEEKIEAYLSEPSSFIAEIFNALDFNMDKWARLTKPQQVIIANMLEWVGNGDVDLGRRRMSDSMQAYDVLSSGWRVRTMLQRLEAVYRNEYGTQKDADGVEAWKKVYETIGLGMKLKNFGKNYRWTDHRNKEDRGKNRQELEKTWQAIAKYRPQEILKAFAETVHYKWKRDKDTGMLVFDYDERTGAKIKQLDPKRPNVFAQIFGRDASGRRQVTLYDESGAVIDNFEDLEKYVGKYFYSINDLLEIHEGFDRGADGKRLNKGLPAIDYSHDYAWLRAHQPKSADIVDKVFKAKIGEENNWQQARDRYFAAMKTLTQIGNGDMHVRVRGAEYDTLIDELIDNVDYEWVYTNHVRFFDDARLAELQNQGNSGVTTISSYFHLGKGVGQGDMVARAWGDLAEAKRGLDAMYGVLTSLDKDKLFENATQLWNSVKIVEGPGEASSALAYAVGAWLNSAKAPYFASILGMDKLPIRISDFQKKLGLSAPSLNPNELHEIREYLDRIGGDLDELIHDPVLKANFERIGGVRKVEVYAFRFRTIFLIILFFMLQEMLKEANKAEAA